jgi:actin-related protein
MTQTARDWCCPVVIDVGTSFTKAGTVPSALTAIHAKRAPRGQMKTLSNCLAAGYGGNLDPAVCLPTAVNRVRQNDGKNRDPTHPLKNGIVVDWSEYEQLLDLCFREYAVQLLPKLV